MDDLDVLVAAADSAVVTRQRGVEFRPFPARRRFVTGALHAARRSTPMHGLIEVDVTETVRVLHRWSPPLSLTAFVVACMARAASAHPEVHAYRDWRGRLVRARHVDVGTMIEIATEDGPFPMPHLIRDADIRGVDDISAEIRAVQRAPTASSTSRWLDRYGPIVMRIPGLVRLFYHLMGKSPRMREISGTVGVSAVGMFGDGGGFGIPGPNLMSLMVVVGGMSERARVVDGQIRVRHVLDLTISIDHDIVDGAPAARFAANLRQLIENPDPMDHLWLDSAGPPR